MAKTRVHDISKDMEIASKEVLEVLAQNGVVGKSTMSALEMHELDIIFEVLTKRFDDGSSLEEHFQIIEGAPEPESEKVEHKGKEQGDGKKPEKEVKVARVVDTRANVVDLEKFNTEKIEKLVNDLDDRATTSQKIGKKAPMRGKYIKPDDSIISPEENFDDL